MTRSQYQFTLQGPDTDELYRVRARSSKRRCTTSTGCRTSRRDLQITQPAGRSVDLDREQIAALGLTADQVEIALNSAYGTRQVSQIYAPNDEYQVIMQVAPQYQRDPAALVDALRAGASGGKLVPLSAVGDNASRPSAR